MTGSSSQLWLCARSAKFTIIAYYPLRQSGENQPQGTCEGRFSGFWLILGNSDSVPTKNLEPQGTLRLRSGQAPGRTEAPGSLIRLSLGQVNTVVSDSCMDLGSF